MHDHEPYGVDSCPALAVSVRGFCVVHDGARRAKHVLRGTHCQLCKRLVVTDDWITEASTASEMTHAVCPPPRAAFSRKKDSEKPLLTDGVLHDGR